MARTINSQTKQRPRIPPEAAGLRYSTACRPGFSRARRGSGFRYIGPHGKVIRSREQLARFEAIVIPPAWTDVWICADPRGHLQRRDAMPAAGRCIAITPKWRQIRDETKYDRLIGSPRRCPRSAGARAGISERLTCRARRSSPRSCSCSRKRCIRVGNDEYAKENQSFGLTTMRDAHVQVNGTRLRFLFRGKSGVEHDIDLTDRRLARSGPGVPRHSRLRAVSVSTTRASGSRSGRTTSTRISRRSRARTDTSKDFRTWAGTVLAAQLLWAFAQCQFRCGGQAQHRRSGRGDGQAPWEYEGRLPQELHPPGPCSTTTSRRDEAPRRARGTRAVTRPPARHARAQPPASRKDYRKRKSPCCRCSSDIVNNRLIPNR